LAYQRKLNGSKTNMTATKSKNERQKKPYFMIHEINTIKIIESIGKII
jgi:hypothetical protein